jgi:serine phosphatase RsbU (regulator of sigma subunit)/anti-sigma regulatory factor (Ser/Thr protein kinase)
VTREWPVDDVADLVLAVSEAVSNACEHAYPATELRAVEPVVTLVVSELADALERRIEVVIEDFGGWRPAAAEPGFRGHGLRLIGALTASCEVLERGSGTTVTMISNSVPRLDGRASGEDREPTGAEPVVRYTGGSLSTIADADGQTAVARERLRWLEVVTDSELAHLSVDRLLGELLERVRELMSVDTAAVLLLDPSRQFLIATVARGIEEEVHQGVRIPLGRGFAGRIAGEGRWVAIDQVDHDNVLNPILRDKGIVSMLGVPLMAAGAVTGVLHVGTLTKRGFSEQDAELLQMVADRAALATQARMLHEERAAAAVMQRALLPSQPPRVPGFEFASRYVTGGEGEVGGDWYDVFTLPSGTVCLVVGDVVGHGLVAAQSMSQLRAVLRTITLHTEDPAEVLTMLDQHAVHFLPEAMATVLCAMLRPASDRLTISCAGHPPPILARPDDESGKVAITTDLPVGVELGHPRHAADVPFPAGSVLCLYSDGLVERRRLLVDVNIEKLRSVVSTGPAEQVAVDIMGKLIGLDVPEDDVAVLIARRLTGAAPAVDVIPAAAG